MSDTSAHEDRPYARLVPQLAQLSAQVLYGQVWQGPGLSQRDRSLVTVAALIALYRPQQLAGHVDRALANGITADEIADVITHLAFYAGWPCAVTAAEVLAHAVEVQ